MVQIRLRFNTQWESSEGAALKWRLLFPDGTEQVVKSVQINVPSWTSEDRLASGATKWHVTCEGVLELREGHAVIRAPRQG